MVTQSFLYNAIFFSYTIVLTVFYHVDGSCAAVRMAFAIGNLIGPLVLGPLFDTVGRRKMIAGSYLISGVLLAVGAFLFNAQRAQRDDPDPGLGDRLLLRVGRVRARPT